MITGVVNAHHEAVVCLRILGPGGIALAVDTIVDSGFTSSLTLPDPMIQALGLVKHSTGNATLADGTTRQFDVCIAEIEWDGTLRRVSVYAVGDEPLLGMRLLARHKLSMEVVPGGLVEIVPLP
jgi:clan AA aspartic protease